MEAVGTRIGIVRGFVIGVEKFVGRRASRRRGTGKCGMLLR